MKARKKHPVLATLFVCLIAVLITNAIIGFFTSWRWYPSRATREAVDLDALLIHRDRLESLGFSFIDDAEGGALLYVAGDNPTALLLLIPHDAEACTAKPSISATTTHNGPGDAYPFTHHIEIRDDYTDLSLHYSSDSPFQGQRELEQYLQTLFAPLNNP